MLFAQAGVAKECGCSCFYLIWTCRMKALTSLADTPTKWLLFCIWFLLVYTMWCHCLCVSVCSLVQSNPPAFPQLPNIAAMPGGSVPSGVFPAMFPMMPPANDTAGDHGEVACPSCRWIVIWRPFLSTYLLSSPLLPPLPLPFPLPSSPYLPSPPLPLSAATLPGGDSSWTR